MLAYTSLKILYIYSINFLSFCPMIMYLNLNNKYYTPHIVVATDYIYNYYQIISLGKI